jgi:hypothetical protein
MCHRDYLAEPLFYLERRSSPGFDHSRPPLSTSLAAKHEHIMQCAVRMQIQTVRFYIHSSAKLTPWSLSILRTVIRLSCLGRSPAAQPFTVDTCISMAFAAYDVRLPDPAQPLLSGSFAILSDSCPLLQPKLTHHHGKYGGTLRRA